MKTLFSNRQWRCRTVLSALTLLTGQFAGAAVGATPLDICGATTEQLYQACNYQVADDFRVGSAICLNLRNDSAAEFCRREARMARYEAYQECWEIQQARNEICAVLGPAAYDPAIIPAHFVAGINNRYAPFKPGAFWVYEKRGAEGVERIRVEVLNRPRMILGVKVTALRDRVWLDGELIEDTIDWVAQHRNGDVWYFGELVKNYEEGRLVSLDGSFEAGKEGAKPGILMKAAPVVGEVYRIEYALNNEAEDIAEVLSRNATDTVIPFRDQGSGPVLKTRDTTPLEPGVEEFKYYVPGIGMVLEVDPETGERLVLIKYGRQP